MVKNFCNTCEFAYNSDEKKKRFSCWRYNEHIFVDDYPQNYGCGDWVEKVVDSKRSSTASVMKGTLKGSSE